jgi:hypothetical protein
MVLHGFARLELNLPPKCFGRSQPQVDGGRAPVHIATEYDAKDRKARAYKLLRNWIYLGEIVHKEARYPGRHDAITSTELWDRVQQQLAKNRVERELGSGPRALSSLSGSFTTKLDSA